MNIKIKSIVKIYFYCFIFVSIFISLEKSNGGISIIIQLMFQLFLYCINNNIVLDFQKYSVTKSAQVYNIIVFEQLIYKNIIYLKMHLQKFQIYTDAKFKRRQKIICINKTV